MLHSKELISMEILDKVTRYGVLLTEGLLRVISSLVSEDSNKLKLFGNN